LLADTLRSFPAAKEIKKVTASDRSEPGFPVTLHSPTPACAAFSKESRMKFANATKSNRKSGERSGEPALSEVKGDLRFLFQLSRTLGWGF